MGTKIVIEPVSRVEGHGKVAVYLNERGHVDKAQLHITQVRGFEKFCEGRLFNEMLVITPRICGICPVSHHLAAAKACDEILNVQLTPTAEMLRRLLHYAQLVQSHASLHNLTWRVKGWPCVPLGRRLLNISARKGCIRTQRFPEG